MKSIGIIAAKYCSKRFPGKNLEPINGKPLYLHNVDILLASKYISEIYILTESDFITKDAINYNERIMIIPDTIYIHERPLFEVIKWAYYSTNIRADIIASIMANTIGHTLEIFDKAMEKIITNENLKEIRSFDKDGNISGINIYRESVMRNSLELSYGLGAVFSNAKEIHYKEELDDYEK